MNCQAEYAKTLGANAYQFYKECLVIREHIYRNMYFPESAIYNYYKDSREFHSKTLEEQKVSVQNIYLQSKETDYVYRFNEIYKIKC